MANEKAKRCRYCGGTIWYDGDVLKCFQCSRPANSEIGFDRILSRFSNPKLPGTSGKTGYRRSK